MARLAYGLAQASGTARRASRRCRCWRRRWRRWRRGRARSCATSSTAPRCSWVRGPPARAPEHAVEGRACHAVPCMHRRSVAAVLGSVACALPSSWHTEARHVRRTHSSPRAAERSTPTPESVRRPQGVRRAGARGARGRAAAAGAAGGGHGGRARRTRRCAPSCTSCASRPSGAPARQPLRPPAQTPSPCCPDLGRPAMRAHLCPRP
jgi:hypothetical protein